MLVRVACYGVSGVAKPAMPSRSRMYVCVCTRTVSSLRRGLLPLHDVLCCTVLRRAALYRHAGKKVKENAAALACSHVVGYKESCSINGDVCLLSCIGTAVVFHHDLPHVASSMGGRVASWAMRSVDTAGAAGGAAGGGANSPDDGPVSVSRRRTFSDLSLIHI